MSFQFQCLACNHFKPEKSFSNNQLKKQNSKRRRCKKCIKKQNPISTSQMELPLKNRKRDSNTIIISEEIKQLFGAIFVSIGPTLNKYLSLVDVYHIIKTGIFGDIRNDREEWQQYFPFQSLLSLYTSAESLNYRNILICRNHNIDHFELMIGKTNIFNICIKPMNYTFNNNADNIQKYNSQIKVNVNNMKMCTQQIYTQTFNKIIEKMNETNFSFDNIQSVKAILGYLLSNIDQDLNKPIMPAGVNLYFDTMYPKDIESIQHKNEKYFSLSYKTILNYWTNFYSFFNHIKIEKQSGHICPKQFYINELMNPMSTKNAHLANWWKWSIRNYKTYDEMIEKENIKNVKIVQYLSSSFYREYSKEMSDERIDVFGDYCNNDTNDDGYEQRDGLKFSSFYNMKLPKTFNIAHTINISKDFRNILFMPELIPMHQWYIIDCFHQDWWSGEHGCSDSHSLIIGHINNTNTNNVLCENKSKFIAFECSQAIRKG
eukprot:555228_1